MRSSVSNAGGIFEAVKHPKSFISLDDAQRKWLVEIADGCTVHKTLEQSSVVVIKLMELASA